MSNIHFTLDGFHFGGRPALRDPRRERGGWAAFVTALKCLVRELRLRHEERKARDELNAMSDYLLHDLGVSRGEIDQVVRYRR